MSEVLFSELAFKQYVEWQTEDKRTLRKINSLLKSIERDGAMAGEGKPEKLRGRKDTYSRRIDDANRLIYEVSDKLITVKSCKTHYGDK